MLYFYHEQWRFQFEWNLEHYIYQVSKSWKKKLELH